MTMPEFVAFPTQCIAANSTYPPPEVPRPTAVAMTPVEIAAEFHAGSGIAAARRPPSNLRVLGLDSTESGMSGTTDLIDPVLTGSAGGNPLADPIFHERLLHNVVHNGQRRSGACARFRCRAACELDACHLGGLFLRPRHAPDLQLRFAFSAAARLRC